MPTEKSSSPAAANIWLLVALVIALIGTWGSLHLSMGMGLKACPLCFYQRTFVMSVLAVLVMGWLSMWSTRSASREPHADQADHAAFLCLLCVPLSVAGLGVAAFHEYLVLAGKLECPPGLFELGTAPAQSLALLAALTLALFWGARSKFAWTPPAILLGLVLSWACVASAPPMPPAPDKPYDKPPDICRVPYQSGPLTP